MLISQAICQSQALEDPGTIVGVQLKLYGT